jgi:nucleotide-binding universal stress UspA family protein
MSNVILVVVDHPDLASALLAAAGRLAELAGPARINVLAIRVPPIETVMPTEEILSENAELRIRAEEQKRVDSLKSLFDAWAGAVQSPTVSPCWHDVEGRANVIAGEWGRRSDMIVVSRTRPQSPQIERQTIQAAVFDTDRPVLVVPPDLPSAAFGKRVAIAWRDDPRTLKAVLVALRCLGGAEHIAVLAGIRDGAPPAQLPKVLEEHGMHADLHVLPIGPGPFGQALLDKVDAVGADLLVMGAYAHSPLQEFVLGGVTRYMLTHAGLPVLMRH